MRIDFRKPVVVLMLGLVVGTAVGAFAAWRLAACRADREMLETRLLYLMAVKDGLERIAASSPHAPGTTDRETEPLDRALVQSIVESERLTARGARLDEPWASVYPFAREVEALVAGRGLDREIAEKFWLTARRLAGEAT